MYSILCSDELKYLRRNIINGAKMAEQAHNMLDEHYNTNDHQRYSKDKCGIISLKLSADLQQLVR